MMSLNISHNWKIKSFTSITFCDHCGSMLWGICAQGYQCSDCNFSSHSHCTSLVTLHCNNNKNKKNKKNDNNSETNNTNNTNNTDNTNNTITNTNNTTDNMTTSKITTIKNEESFNSESSLIGKNKNNINDNNNIIERQHNFYKTSKAISKFCNYCRETTFTISGEPIMCSECRYISHGHCQSKVPKNCIIPYAVSTINNNNNNNINNNNINEISTSTRHHWVEGNLKENKKCIQCLEPCEKSFSLAHYKCLWCNKQIHSSCFDKHNPICDFGSLSDMILPPSAVRLLSTITTTTTTTTTTPSDESSPSTQSPSLSPSSSFSSSSSSTIEWELIENSKLPDKLLFVFVNSKSGGQFGNKLIKKLSSLLNPVQIVDLIKNGGPDSTLEIINRYLAKHPEQVSKFRILACGGDGTVGWIFKQMTKLSVPSSIPIGIIPLGTGNDLARSLGWGIGYDGEKLINILKNINDSKTIQMDTWSIKMSDDDTTNDIRTIEMNNYFSIGLDASVALGFHLARNANPQLFTGRTVNKLWYTKIGLEEFVTKSFVKLSKILKINIGEKEIKIDKSIEGIIILNLGSYAGGVDLWGQNKKDKDNNTDTNSNNSSVNNSPLSSPTSGTPTMVGNQYIDDQMLEIIGVTSLPHLGSCLSSISSPIKMGQGDEIRIQVSMPSIKNNNIQTAWQVDGEPEPIEVRNCTFKISFFKKVSMLSHQSFKPRVGKSSSSSPSSTTSNSVHISQSPYIYSPPTFKQPPPNFKQLQQQQQYHSTKEINNLPNDQEHDHTHDHEDENINNINTPFEPISLPIENDVDEHDNVD